MEKGKVSEGEGEERRILIGGYMEKLWEGGM